MESTPSVEITTEKATGIPKATSTCPVCKTWVSKDETTCAACGLRFNIGTPETELLRTIAYNTYRIRKHVVIWSTLGAVLLVLGVVVELISLASH